MDVLLSDNIDTVNVLVTENLLPSVHGKRNAANRVTSIWSSNTSLDWAKTTQGNLNQSSSSYCSSPITTSTQLQPLRPIAKFDRFPMIETSSPRYMEKPTRWKKGEILGQGAFGVVYLGLNTETGELMAVKQMTLDDISKKEMSALENEINMLRSLRHPNIVRYIGTEVTPSTLSIFLEYVPGGSLKSLIDKFGKLEESVARSYTRQLLLGLEYLHRNGIAHRDVKGANCLVGNDGAIKLADFGASKQWRPQVHVDQIDPTTGNVIQRTESGSHEVRGTPSWMAPEVIRNDDKHLNWKKADVWSLGCTTIEMTTGKSPWAQFTNPVTVLYHIACSDSLPEYPENPSVELLTFLNTCLQRDPLNRPDITSLLLHPFVANASYLNPTNNPGGNYGYRPSTVSTTPSMGDWERESLSSTWKTSTSRSVLGPPRHERDHHIGGQPFIPERDPVPDIPPVISQHLASGNVKYSPRYGDNSNLGKNTTPQLSHPEIHPPVGNPDIDLEATVPRALVDNALRAYQRDVSLSPVSTVERIPGMETHSLENSLEASDLEDSSNTFESSRVLAVPSSDDEYATSLATQTKVSTAARRRGKSGHHQSQYDESIPRIPEGSEYLSARKVENITPLLSTKEETLYAADSLVSSDRKNVKEREDKQMKRSQDKPSKARKRGDKGVPASIASRVEESLTPPRKNASVISLSSPINVESPKASGRKVPNSNRNKLEVLETESSSKKGRRPFEYLPTLSNSEVSVGPNEQNISGMSTPRVVESINESVLNSTWRSDKSGQIEDELDQKELSDRFFSLRNADIQDESEVYDEIPNHGSFSEDDIPAAELSDDCEILENSLAHLSDDDVVDFASDDYSRKSMPSDDWLRQQPNGKNVLEMSVLNDEEIPLRKEGAAPRRKEGEQWAGVSTKKQQPEHSITMSPSMPSLDIARSKVDGYTLIGQSLGNHTLGTPKTDIRVNKHSGSILKNTSAKSLHRGVGTATIRRNLEISGDSIDLRHSGANTANAISRKPRDSIDATSLTEIQSTGNQYSLGDEDSQLEDSLNTMANPILNPSCDVLDEHTSAVTKLRLNSAKRLLFSASSDGTIRIWSAQGYEGDAQTMKSKMVLDVAAFAKEASSTGTLTRKPSGNKNAVVTPTRPIRTNGLWVDDTCETVWGGYSDGVVRVWVSDGRPMRALKGHDDSITCVEGCETAVSSALGSPHVTSTGSTDKTVRVWDIRAKRSQVALFKGHNDSILSMKWIDSGRSLVSASKDRSIKIWDFRSGRYVFYYFETHLHRLRISLDKHFGSVNVIKALPDQTGPQIQDRGLPSFISGARDGMINIWTNNGDCLSSQGAHRNSVNCMSEIQSADNTIDRSILENPNIITSGADHQVKIWDLKRLKLLTEFTCPNVMKVAWFHSSIITGNSAGQMLLWENTSSSDNSYNWITHELTAHTQMITDIVSNKYCVISSSKSGQINRWNSS